MAEVNLLDVSKDFGQHRVVHEVNLTIDHGEFAVFVGPSGCGKSTLLRMIAGLEEITDGALVIDGEVMNEVPAAQRHIAMVFQSYALYPHMSVRKNLAFGLETAREPRAAIEEKVQEAARILQIQPLLDRKPRQLSGGQRQRVAIGRAIVREPKVFLFDEPLSNLDAELRVQMRVEISKLHQRLDSTMIYVTHDQVEAMTMADKIIVLNAGQVEQVGSPLELYNNPRNIFVAGFIGSPRMNFLEARIEAMGEGTLTLQVGGGRLVVARLPEGAKVGDRVTLGVRPEHISLVGGSDLDLSAEISLTEHLGDETYLYGTLAGGKSLIIHSPGQSKVEAGEHVPIGLSAGLCHVFGSEGLAFRPSESPPATRVEQPKKGTAEPARHA